MALLKRMPGEQVQTRTKPGKPGEYSHLIVDNRFMHCPHHKSVEWNLFFRKLLMYLKIIILSGVLKSGSIRKLSFLFLCYVNVVK